MVPRLYHVFIIYIHIIHPNTYHLNVCEKVDVFLKIYIHIIHPNIYHLNVCEKVDGFKKYIFILYIQTYII